MTCFISLIYPKEAFYRSQFSFNQVLISHWELRARKEDSHKPEKMWGRCGESLLHLEHSERGGIRGP